MKKYLMMGLATLAFAACVSDKEVTVQTQEEKYEKAFEQLVGGPVNANVNWGFDAVQATAIDAEGNLVEGMRHANVNGNMPMRIGIIIIYQLTIKRLGRWCKVDTH